ncbi:hypothetical protein FRB97_004882 [Tulasnella sp. 331]|nr:hypothetical protein FRB97_004882 [Tulasnella sp. 331]
MIKRITKQQDKRKKREAEYEELGITKDMREEMGLGDGSDLDSESSDAEPGSESGASDDSAASSLVEALNINPLRRKEDRDRKSTRSSGRQDAMIKDEDASIDASSSRGDKEVNGTRIKARAYTLKHLNVPELMTHRKSGTQSCVLCDKILNDGDNKLDVVQKHLKSATHRRRLLYFKTKIMKRLNQTGDTNVAIERAKFIRKIVRDVANEGKAQQEGPPEGTNLLETKASKNAVTSTKGAVSVQPQLGKSTGKKRRRERRQKKD